MHKYTFDKRVYVELEPCLHCGGTEFHHMIGDYPIGLTLQPFPFHTCTNCNAFYYNEHDVLIETTLFNIYKRVRAKHEM